MVTRSRTFLLTWRLLYIKRFAMQHQFRTSPLCKSTRVPVPMDAPCPSLGRAQTELDPSTELPSLQIIAVNPSVGFAITGFMSACTTNIDYQCVATCCGGADIAGTITRGAPVNSGFSPFTISMTGNTYSSCTLARADPPDFFGSHFIVDEIIFV